MNAGYASSRIEKMPFRGYILKIVLLISLGGLFEGYDLFMTAYIVPTLIKGGIFQLKTSGIFDMNAVASFVAALFAGMFVGAALLGRLPDKYGRKVVFTYALLGYSICTFVMAFQTEALWINFWRFLACIGIGLEVVTIDIYVSELVPSRYRGRAIALTQTVLFLGLPIVALLAWLLIPISFLGLEGWRWVVIIGAIGAVLIWKIRQSIPESPIWLERQGEHEKSRAVLASIESSVFGKKGYAAANKAIPTHPLDPATSFTDALIAETPSTGGWAVIFSPAMRWRVVMMVVVNICITVGYYGFASWVPTLLTAKGITITKSLEYSVLMALAAPLAPALSMLVADRFERKYQVILTCSLCALLGIAFSVQSAPAVIILIGFLLTLNNGWMSSSYHTYQAELFPTQVRAQAVGFVYSWSRFSSIFCGYIVAYLISRYGTIGVFTFITANMIVIVVTLLAFGPKTNKTIVA